MEKLARQFRILLVVWAVLLVAHFTWIAVATDGGRTLPQFEWWKVWHPFWVNILYAVGAVVPAVLFHWRIAAHYGGMSSYVGRSIILLTWGAICWAAGNLFWFVYNGTGNEAPYPSLADIGYLLLLPLAGAALYFLTRVLALTWADLLRWSWIFVVLALVTGYFTLPATDSVLGVQLPFTYGEGTLVDPEYQGLELIVAVLYIIADVVLLGFSMILLVRSRDVAGGAFFWPVLIIVAAFVFQYVADMFFFYRDAVGSYYNGDISDMLYAAFMFCLPLAVYAFLAAERRVLADMSEIQGASELVAESGV